MADIKGAERIEILRFMNERQGYTDPFNTLQYYTQMFLFIAEDYTFLYLCTYLLVSFLALYYQTQGFLIAYSVLMLDVVIFSDDMINVINAITYNMNQLLYTLILGIIVMYNYTLFAFTYIDDTFYNTSIGFNGGENMCTTMVQCFMTIFSLGPRSSGGIGDMLVR